MATRKKTQKKKSASSKKTTARRSSKSVASSGSRKITAKPKTAKPKAVKAKAKDLATRSGAGKNTATRRVGGKKVAPRETPRVFRSSIPTRGEGQSVETVNLDPKGLGPKSGGQSGDLQGLSNIEGADSESVGELLEEGNSFEAEVVKGVQDAPDADESEVHTHQVREELELDEDFREN
jgi:hypothetical protein